MTSTLAPGAGRPALQRYVVMETLVGATMSAIMSLIMAWVVFHADARVPTSGAGVGSLIFDAIPQSFMVALMSVLAVSLLTRARARKGHLLPLAPRGGLAVPRNLVVRAVSVAVVAAVVGFLGFRLLAQPLAPGGVTFVNVLIVKAIYGAILSTVIVPFAAVAALKDSG